MISRNNKCRTILSMVVVLVLAVSLIGCGNKTANDTGSNNAASQKQAESTEVKGLEKAIAEQPAMLTAVGQSADAQMVKALMDKAEITYEFNTVVKADELKDTKTLILAVGGSSKGLGAAGIDAEDELKRTEEIINKAKENNVTIIAVHIGGEARRGELSDKFIRASVPKADYTIIVEGGNKDGLFTEMVSQSGIPMDSVKTIAEVVEPLKKAFK